MHDFAAIREKMLHLAEHIHYQEKDGRLEVDGNRKLTLSARAFGRMRLELIKTIGADLARGVLKRYGYQAGFDDAHYLCRKFPGLSLEEQMHLGTLLHQREGAARVETVPEETHINLDAGILKLHSRWYNSLEAEQHLEQAGPSTTPVCWSLAGYAAGHLSFLLQEDVVVQELSCMAQGRQFCSFQVGFKDDMERLFPGCMDDFRTIDLLGMFKDLQKRIEEQHLHIADLEAKSRDTVPPSPFNRLIGNSNAMKKIIETAKTVAGVDSTLLVIGESGTGKELMARAVHETSPRLNQPFVTVNCATLTESLQNAELFGYVRGAFTGANNDKPGLFEDADNGTLFLDEIGELSASAQAALLRVLQEGKVSRVGETREREVNVRVVAATHRNLEDMVAAQTFRQDLFFRLNVVQLRIPPLRERENDVLLLATHFIERFSKKFHKHVDGMSPEVVRLFLRYSWPGNVRELQNAIERSVLLCATRRLEVMDLPDCLIQKELEPRQTPQPAEPKLESIENPPPDEPYDEKAAVEAAMRRAGGMKQEAAVILGISRATLWRKIKQYGLRSDKGYWRNGA
ncbi:MAG: sigma 54-interacting transcriptional regulator [Acidobacteriota bacterium]|nr:sigma 54-interacting transcriptional regulator [Acidobacteriota bacterium]